MLYLVDKRNISSCISRQVAKLNQKQIGVDVESAFRERMKAFGYTDDDLFLTPQNAPITFQSRKHGFFFQVIKKGEKVPKISATERRNILSYCKKSDIAPTRVLATVDDNQIFMWRSPGTLAEDIMTPRHILGGVSRSDLLPVSKPRSVPRNLLPKTKKRTYKTFDVNDKYGMQKWGEDNYGSWMQNMSKAEWEAIDAYQSGSGPAWIGSGAKDNFHQRLRRGARPTEADKKKIRVLDNCLKKAEAKEDFTIYRGYSMDGDKAEKILKKGKYFSDGSYSSWTLDLDTATSYAGAEESTKAGTLLKIKVPKKANIGHVSQLDINGEWGLGAYDEQELVMGRDPIIKITGKRNKTITLRREDYLGGGTYKTKVVEFEGELVGYKEKGVTKYYD